MKITAPVRISRQGDEILKIAWNDGTLDSFPVRNLRLSCPCAACVNEWTGQKILDDKQIPAFVKPAKVFSVGRYAMGIHWTDGHKTGIFAYDYLKKLALR
jgi:DUF971 family protein